jgi:hypothetical protein
MPLPRRTKRLFLSSTSQQEEDSEWGCGECIYYFEHVYIGVGDGNGSS